MVKALDKTIPARVCRLLGSNGVLISTPMRTLLPILVALVLFAGLGIPARAQDASKIVDQYINAAGGAKGENSVAGHRRDVYQRLGPKSRDIYVRCQVAEPLLFGARRRRQDLDRNVQRQVSLARKWRRGNRDASRAGKFSIGRCGSVLQRAAAQSEEEQAGIVAYGSRAGARQRRVANRSDRCKWNQTAGVFRCSYAFDRGRESGHRRS